MRVKNKLRALSCRTMCLSLSVILLVITAYSHWWYRSRDDSSIQHQETEETALNNSKNSALLSSKYRSNNTDGFISDPIISPTPFYQRDSPYPGVDSYVKYAMYQRGLKFLENVQPLHPAFGAQVLYDVTSFRYSIEPSSLSSSRKPVADRKRLFVSVISAPNYFEKRQTVRDTWRQHLNETFAIDSIEVVGFSFMIGKTNDENVQLQINQESEKYGDILQVEIVDSYQNLTLKSIALMNWLNTKCIETDYVLKADDDIYVNVRHLIAVLTSNDASNPQIFGLGLTHPPLRIGKWAIGYEEWPWKEYPFYLAGGVVLIGARAVFPLLSASQMIPFLQFEDLFMTGLCAEMANVTAVYSPMMLGQKEKSDYNQIKQWVTWLTDTEWLMYKLHVKIDNFYRGTPCYSQPLNVTKNSKDIHPCVVDFEFVEHIQQTLS